MAASSHEETSPDTHDASEADLDVAAAMGFGSFGSKPHLTKRRKVESIDDLPSSQSSIPIRQGLDASSKEGLHSHGRLDTLSTESERSAPVRATGASSLAEVPTGLPPKPPANDLNLPGQDVAGDQMQSRDPGKRADGEWDWYALRRGVKEKNGDVAYYDSSFVEDPWAHLKDKR